MKSHKHVLLRHPECVLNAAVSAVRQVLTLLALLGLPLYVHALALWAMGKDMKGTREMGRTSPPIKRESLLQETSHYCISCRISKA